MCEECFAYLKNIVSLTSTWLHQIEERTREIFSIYEIADGCECLCVFEYVRIWKESTQVRKISNHEEGLRLRLFVLSNFILGSSLLCAIVDVQRKW